MYNVRWLTQLARTGLADLVPAVRQAFNDNPNDDRLVLVYGARPRIRIVAIAVLGGVLGSLLANFLPPLPFRDAVNWPAVAIGAVHAALFRRYLFGTSYAQPADFPWLAASLAPAALLLMLLAGGASLATGASATGVPAMFGLGVVLVAAADALGVAAALTIAVAALCFSRNWLRALWHLAVRLLVFRIMVWITVLIMLDIGVVGPIVAWLLGGLFDLKLPEWLPELVDQISYAVFLSIAYLAVIGATWTVCRRSFETLLETGEVDVLATVAALASDPARAEKKRHKKAQKLARRAAKKAAVRKGH